MPVRNRPRHLRHGLLAVLTLVTAGDAADESRRLLRWKLRPDANLKVQITQTNRAEIVGQGVPLVMVVQLAMELAWHVDRVDADGTLRLNQSFTRLVIKTTGPDAKTVQYDSSSPEAPPTEMQEFVEAVRGLLGSRCLVTMTPCGELRDVKPAPETESLLRHLPGAGAALRILSTPGLNQALRQSLGRLPEHPVAAGDTWNDTYEVDSPSGKMRLANTYTCQGPSHLHGHPVERISLTTVVTIPSKLLSARESTPPLRQEYDGTFYFDAVSGCLAQSEMQQTRSSEVTYHDKSMRLHASNAMVLKIRAYATR